MHSLVTTDAAQADITQLPALVHGQETTLYGYAHNATRSKIRARCEQGVHVVKRRWGYTKVRYRGLAKNTTRAFALANLYLVRKRLVPHGT